ncbi:MAG: carboxypeptidase-like regulatory domain-containing protein [Pyrinomonadaceae bacterium]|nr:carboxypeptidase-like regulatory domain-containing protein [Pyrinomonadaceae bacterium]
MRNTIITENYDNFGIQSDICLHGGAFNSLGNNLFGVTNLESQDFIRCQVAPFSQSDIIGQSPLFAPFGNYGGATMTIPLLGNSPAVNAGNNCVITLNGCGDNNSPLPADQRGAVRVGNVDIGAFELNNTANGGTFRAATTGGKVGTPYNFVITPNSGAFAYSLTAGSLPPGLSLTNAPPTKPGRPSAEGLLSAAPQAGAYAVTGTPITGGTFNYTITATNGTNSVSTNYRTMIQAGPTAADVSVGGRVLNGKRGIASAQVVLTDQNGNARTALTNPFGYFRFENVPVGETYIVSVRDKRYEFAPQVVSLTEEFTNLIFAPINNRSLLSNETSK